MSSRIWLAGALAAANLLVAADNPNTNVRVVEEIVAKVNSDIITSGELAKPQPGTFMPVSDAALRDHTTAPLRASSAFRIPVAPNV